MKTNFLKIILYPLILILVLSANLYGQTKPEQKNLNVAILVYDGIYLLDFTGPLEVFFDTFSTDGQQLFNVYTVSPTKQFKAHSGLNITSDYEVINCPKPDILVVPGGNLQLLKNNDSLKNWIINTAEKSQLVMSVCTGAFILADTGLLNGLNITTWYGALDKLQDKVKSAKVVKGVRYTDNGKIITTSGVSAGIDGALYVVSKIFGKETADRTAKYMDYEYWK
jgi:transcriptional regulator GlxA family with amidase domain